MGLGATPTSNRRALSDDVTNFSSMTIWIATCHDYCVCLLFIRPLA
ncbi:hypothetical protein [Candidatus Tisiphia endosymbiont of Sialis lutaria]